MSKPEDPRWCPAAHGICMQIPECEGKCKGLFQVEQSELKVPERIFASHGERRRFERQMTKQAVEQLAAKL